jgi:hypothetical protein
MKQERLNYLAIMNIEHQLLREIDVDDVVKEFAAKKNRKVSC